MNVTGGGALTPAGAGTQALWQGLVAGRCWLDALPGGVLGAPVPQESLQERAPRFRGARRLPRATQMALYAVDDALATAGPHDDGTGIVLGTCFASLDPIFAFCENCERVGPAMASPALFPDTVLNAAAGHVSVHFALRGPTATVSCGLLSGGLALRYAADLFAQNAAERLIVCATDAMPSGRLLAAMEDRVARGQRPVRPLDGDAGGYPLGEGAAALALEGGAEAPAAGIPRIAAVAYVTGHDSRASAAAMQQALAAAELPPERLGALLLPVSGDAALDGRALAAVAAAFGPRAGPLPCLALKAALGESFACYGLLAVLVAARAVSEGLLPPTPGAERLQVPGDWPGRLRNVSQHLEDEAVLSLEANEDGACATLVTRG